MPIKRTPATRTKARSDKKEKPQQRLRKKRANSATQGVKYQLLEFLRTNADKSFAFKQLLAKFAGKDKKTKLNFEEILTALVDNDTVKKSEDGNFQINNEPDFATGVIDFVNPNYAFFRHDAEEEADIWIAADDLGGALDGDTVRIQVFEGGRNKKPEGKVVEILNRARETFVGKIEILAKYAFVNPDYRKMHYDIFVPKDHIGRAKDGDKVVVKLTRYPQKDENPEGVVVQVLGKAGEHETEMHAIMAEYGLPFRFPQEVEAETDSMKTSILAAEIKKRRDFRSITTFTIDPEDAKDFDDALSVQFLENGNVEIGVHIADVTHYVQPGTDLEKEAYRRATSVYLVDRTIPMLPEKISNELCSLRPNEDKLTFSAVFELTLDGKLVKEWFGRTVIHSIRRFAYEQAQEVLTNKAGDHVKELLLLNDLAKKLRDERLKKGAISFETVEVKFKLDANGKPLGIFPKVRQDAHKLIEEFMLLANKKVAEYVFNMRKTKPKLTMVYRIHESPNEEKLKTLATFVKKFGYVIDTEVDKVAHSLNEMIENVEGKPEENALQNLAIRTMAKAVYSTQAVGHFGLAFPHYTHFTSPIRRYPDMMCHRLLWHYLHNGESVDANLTEAQCKQSSEREKNAAEAERASIKYKQVEYMQNASEGVFEGVVTGVTEFGVYVEMVENRCEGLVRLADMNDDFYELDAKNYRIVGRHSGNIIGFGDKVSVKVKATNLDRRTIDLLFANNTRQPKPKGGNQAVKNQKNTPQKSISENTFAATLEVPDAPAEKKKQNFWRRIWFRIINK